MNLRNRIIGLERLPSDSLEQHPGNWRLHGEDQTNALQTALSSIGIVDAIIVRPIDSGKYQIIDGHLRHSLLPDQEIPCLIVDLNEDEAKAHLAAGDMIASMASPDLFSYSNLLNELMEDASNEMRTLFEDLRDESGLSFLTLPEPEVIGADYVENDVEIAPGKGTALAHETRQLFLHVPRDEWIAFLENLRHYGADHGWEETYEGAIALRILKGVLDD